VHYPEAVADPDTGELVSDAEAAETGCTAVAGTGHAYPGRLAVRRVCGRSTQDGLFPVWRYHAFSTETDCPHGCVTAGCCRTFPVRWRHADWGA